MPERSTTAAQRRSRPFDFWDMKQRLHDEWCDCPECLALSVDLPLDFHLTTHFQIRIWQRTPAWPMMLKPLKQFSQLTPDEQDHLQNAGHEPSPEQIQSRLDWEADIRMPWPKTYFTQSRNSSPIHDLTVRSACRDIP